ncbi:MAG: hypothetical protein AMXMBFR25_08790 [Lysobacterales bacterium]|nr:hypothetical protein [Xanthomonadales bacterium]
MDHAARMDVGQPERDVQQATPDLLRVAAAQIAGIAAGQVFHRQKQHLAAAPGLEHRHQRAVPEGGHQARLAQEALDETGVRGQCRVHDLERDLAPERFLHGEVHRRHAAAAKFAHDPVASNQVAPPARPPHAMRRQVYPPLSQSGAGRRLLPTNPAKAPTMLRAITCPATLLLAASQADAAIRN